MRSVHMLVQDEIAIRVAEWGRGPRQCLLVHGFGDGLHVWSEFAERLAAEFQVLAVDLRGHGGSAWDIDKRYNVPTYTEDLQRVMEAFPADGVVLVGHSLGAEVALRTAARDGSAVAGLLLVDWGVNLEQDIADHIMSEFNQESRTYTSISEYAALLESKRPMASREILRRVAEESLREQSPGVYTLLRDPELGRRDQHEGLYESASWDLLPTIKCPALVMRGAGSSVLSNVGAERMRRQMPRAELRTIAMAGHNVMLDNPAVFYQACSSFVRTQLSLVPQRGGASCG
jgi:esterase